MDSIKSVVARFKPHFAIAGTVLVAVFAVVVANVVSDPTLLSRSSEASVTNARNRRIIISNEAQRNRNVVQTDSQRQIPADPAQNGDPVPQPPTPVPSACPKIEQSAATNEDQCSNEGNQWLYPWECDKGGGIPLCSGRAQSRGNIDDKVVETKVCCTYNHWSWSLKNNGNLEKQDTCSQITDPGDCMGVTARLCHACKWVQYCEKLGDDPAETNNGKGKCVSMTQGDYELYKRYGYNYNGCNDRVKDGGICPRISDLYESDCPAGCIFIKTRNPDPGCFANPNPKACESQGVCQPK